MEKLDHNCSDSRKEVLATADKPYHFVDSGLPYVYLVGIRYFECSCGRTTAEIPAIKQLMQLIARDLVEKPSALVGAEVRFLRKRLGKKAVDFAKELGMTPEHLSRIENDHLSADESTDKLIRFVYAIQSKDAVLLKRLALEVEQLLSSWINKRTPKEIVATVVDNEWRPVAA